MNVITFVNEYFSFFFALRTFVSSGNIKMSQLQLYVDKVALSEENRQTHFELFKIFVIFLYKL